MDTTTGRRPTEKRITIRVPSQVADEVQRLAVDDDRSMNAEIVRALREFVEHRKQQTAMQAS